MKHLQYYFFLFLFILPVISPAQEITAKRSTIYAELFGSAGAYSINFDYILGQKEKSILTMSLGYSYIPPSRNRIMAFPISINGLFFGRKHHLETGLGLTSTFSKDTNLRKDGTFDGGSYEIEQYLHAIPKIGYRYQQPEGGFFARVTFNLIYELYSKTKYTLINKGGTKWVDENVRYMNNEHALLGPFMPWGGVSVGWTF